MNYTLSSVDVSNPCLKNLLKMHDCYRFPQQNNLNQKEILKKSSSYCVCVAMVPLDLQTCTKTYTTHELTQWVVKFFFC